MPFTVNQIARQLSKEYIGIDSDPDYIELVESWINEVYPSIMTTVRWNFSIAAEDTITTVAGTAEYSLATSVGEATAFRNTTVDKPLFLIAREELVRVAVDLDLSGDPRWVYLSGYDSATGKNKVGLWPVPSAVITIKVSNTKQSEQLSSFSTIPFPNDFITVLKTGTRVFCSMDDGQALDAGFWRQMYFQQLELLKYRNSSYPKDRKGKVQDGGGRTSGIPDAGATYPPVW